MRRVVVALVVSTLLVVVTVIARAPSESPRRMVVVPAGWFVLGDDDGPSDERPARRIWLSAFAIDRTEVTNERYLAFVLATDRPVPAYWEVSPLPPSADDLPVVGVGWTDACSYCAWRDARLPTEAQWEKACRGSDGRVYPWGRSGSPTGRTCGSSLSTTPTRSGT